MLQASWHRTGFRPHHWGRTLFRRTPDLGKVLDRYFCISTLALRSYLLLVHHIAGMAQEKNFIKVVVMGNDYHKLFYPSSDAQDGHLGVFVFFGLIPALHHIFEVNKPGFDDVELDHTERIRVESGVSPLHKSECRVCLCLRRWR